VILPDGLLFVMEYEAVIGLEIHAELQTRTKMFCACPVVDSITAQPNTAVCPVCAGLPGVLPVINAQAVEYALKVAMALQCEILPTSIFARKNYFYPDLPKGYQISQYEQPLAINGLLEFHTPQGLRRVRIRRVHIEEDTGKLSHLYDLSGNDTTNAPRSLVDLNRAGVPLLEIVSEPDLHTSADVRLYAMALRSLLRYLGVNSGDLQKGVLRIEPNVSVRPAGSQKLGTRTEIKNLNSFRALERSVAYEIERQSGLLSKEQPIIQQTLGWDDVREVTIPQRSKEDADDYRYFPEPDLPPLVLDPHLIERVRAQIPELPLAKYQRFIQHYGLSEYDTSLLVVEQEVSQYFEQVVQAMPGINPKTLTNWITGELFSLLNQENLSIASAPDPSDLATLVAMVSRGDLNQIAAKTVLSEMFHSQESPASITARLGLGQISDPQILAGMVREVLANHPDQVQQYRLGKTSIERWLFGQVMRAAQGRANPQILQSELDRQLNA